MRPFLSLLVLVLLLPTDAPPARAADAPPSVRIEELTSPELVELIRAGRTTALVPIGGTEQNGPHMALGKHNARAQALSERIARVLGNALVAPVIAYVPEGSITPPSGHMRFAGTLTVPADVFQKTLEGAARSLRAAGFRDIVFLGDHGGYQHDEHVVADRLNREWKASTTRAHALDAYYKATETAYVDTLKQRGFAMAEIGEHAGLADTSLTLAIQPSLVRPERYAAAAQQKEAVGVRGDPRRSTAELGQLGVDVVISQSVAAIRKATARR